MKRLLALGLAIAPCLGSPPASAASYYLVLANAYRGEAEKPALVRYIYDPETPGRLTPAPGRNQQGATLATAPGSYLWGITYHAGKIYAVGAPDRVYRFDAYTGENEGVIIKGLESPVDLVVGPDSYLYITTKSYIARYTLSGTPKAGLDNYGDMFSMPGNLVYGNGIVFDGEGNLLVCSQANSTVIRLSGTTGNMLKYYNLGRGILTDVKRGRDGLFYITATGDQGLDQKGYIVVLDGKTGKTKTATLKDLPDPFGLAFSPDGKLVVGSYSGGRAQVFLGSEPLGVLAVPQGPAEMLQKAVFYEREAGAP